MLIKKYRNVKICATIAPEKCPLCGETKQFIIGNSGGVEGFRHTWFRRRITRFWDLYKYSQEKYRCHSCDAEWKHSIVTEYIHEGLE